MREAFSHRMSEWHRPYSDFKKLFIDCLMRWRYKHESPTLEETAKLAETLKRNFAGKRIGLVSAPGWLVSIFRTAGAKLKFAVHVPDYKPPLTDQAWLFAKFRYFILKARGNTEVDLRYFDTIRNVEVIICDYMNFPRLSKAISERNNGLEQTNILSLADLA
jgi:hypothetical protein